MKTSAIREDDARGRHTTTHRELIKLPNGGLYMDTPGMREIGLLDAGDGMAELYGDIDELAANCRFSDCKHKSEPGCAVQSAIRAGKLDRKRLEKYEKLKREALRSLDRAAYNAMMRKRYAGK
jgi:ribosome biogenesis GTPase